MTKRTIRSLFLIGVFLFSLIQTPISTGQDAWGDETRSFRQEIILPSFTKGTDAQYQPVDTTIRFDSPCWAINETKHSLEVLCHTNSDDLPVEFQLYDLVHSDETHITACNLVFLIPPQTDGTEEYFIYYDGSQTTTTQYPDYVSIEDSSYFYEPIPGYPLESHFYKISQNQTIRYIIAQEGTFLWYTTAQYVTKLKKGSTEVMPKNGETVASFEFAYYYGVEMWEYSSTSQELVSKEILCDGNLMVSCRITSQSTGGDLRTTAVYKYYYCPSSLERIQVHVTHEALKDCQVYPDVDTDGTYASLQCGGIKSSSIADLNFGKISPSFHFISEQDTVEEYQVDLHPEYMKEDPVIHLIQTSDDVDIGKNAWVSFDEGSTGEVHAILFGNSSVIKTGKDERDGIQLKMYESNYPHLPGLDYTIAALQCTRNAYEKNVPNKDNLIPQGFIADYDAEFFSSPDGGYPLIEKEAQIFQALVPMKPSVTSDESPRDNTSSDRFSLKVYVHDAPSFPLGSVFSALTGRDFPYINVELYRDNMLVCAGTASRLPIKGSISSEGVSLKDALSSMIHSFDVRNLSFFKKITFGQLDAGLYVVKVFKENPRIGMGRKFIGYTIVDLTKDSQVHVVCKPQGQCQISLVDQQGNGISDARVMLLQDGMVIAHNTTDTDGSVLLTAPCDWKDRYQLKILYNGFEVINESVRLGYGRIVFPLKKTISLEQYDWMVILVDLWGLSPDIDVVPRLTSTQMQTPTLLVSQEREKGTYYFSNLTSGTYQLQIQYKSFLVEKEIKIPTNDETVFFPAAFPISFHVFDSRGMTLEGVTIQVSRGGITKDTESNDSSVIYSLPPGMYQLKVLSQDKIISQRSLTVLGTRSVDLITNQEPSFPLIVYVLACIVGLIGVAFWLWKKEPLYFTITLMISVLISALVLPWWGLEGSAGNLQTSSSFYLIPLNLVSTTTSSQVIAGELTFFPDIFITVMSALPLLMIIICLLSLCILLLHSKNKKRWQNVLIISTLILLLCSLVLFIGAMSAFTEVGVGSFLGGGAVNIVEQGQDQTVSVDCSWGPGLGFWLSIVSLVILVCVMVGSLRKKE